MPTRRAPSAAKAQLVLRTPGTRPRCRWAAAGPGRASRSTTPSRRLACGDLAGGPPPSGTHSGPAQQNKPRGGRAWPGFEKTRRANHQHTRLHLCGGRRRDRRARAGFEARRRWAAAGPGRASRSTTPSRRLACGDLAGGPPPHRHTQRPGPANTTKRGPAQQTQRSRPAPQGPGGSRIRPLGGSQRFQRIWVPVAPRRSQASTTRAAMPASADLPHVRGSYCFFTPTSPSILRTPS